MGGFPVTWNERNLPVIKTSSPNLPSKLDAHWVLKPPAPASEIERLVKELSIPPLLASVLWARGFRDNVQQTLEPPLTLTEIPALDQAVTRLEHALKNDERILIHGDYDADGITGTAVLTLGLRALGGNVTPFLPNRLTDGYGISPNRISEHIEKADLFITVDCGITNLNEIKSLQDAGVEVIITDHHHIGPEVPNCLIVHPKTSPKVTKGMPTLTGSGVAYHLLWALHERLQLEPPLEYSDLATIGIIADVAPLMGENRALIKVGLERMADSHWLGLRACLKQTRLTRPTARDVAFMIAPRLNASGRLGEAEIGLELLMTASDRRARELAAYLDARNIQRKKIQSQMFQEALEQINKEAPAIVLVDTDKDRDWNPGIMGIVASNVLEVFYKPVFIIAKGKGSVRSTLGISAVEALRYAEDMLERFGGHSQAAGFAISEGNVEIFRQKICDFVAQHPTPKPIFELDALISGDEVDKDIYEALQKLEPYGEGHPSPTFALVDKLKMVRAVGQNGKHLQLRVGNTKGILWDKGTEAANYSIGDCVQVAAILKENKWQGKVNIEFQGKDLRHDEHFAFKNLSSANIKRGKPFELASVYIYGDSATKDLPLWSVEEVLPKELWLKNLPLNDDSLSATKLLQKLIDSNTVLYFDISAIKLAELENFSLLYPSVQDLRLAFVYLQRKQQLPFGKDKTELCTRCLKEIELIDDKGLVKTKQKRDPYTSNTLRKGLMERHKLRSFINSYRYFEEEAFAYAVKSIFSEDVSCNTFHKFSSYKPA